jgi:hypothetical protein
MNLFQPFKTIEMGGGDTALRLCGEKNMDISPLRARRAAYQINSVYSGSLCDYDPLGLIPE